MTPVFQDVFEEGKGNCVAACVASVLDMPLNQVPNFRLASDPWKALQDWLSARRIVAVRFKADWDYLWPLPRLHVILTGNSPKRPNGSHAVVGLVENRGWQVVHDPHPEGNGIEPEWITFFAHSR